MEQTRSKWIDKIRKPKAQVRRQIDNYCNRLANQAGEKKERLPRKLKKKIAKAKTLSQVPISHVHNFLARTAEEYSSPVLKKLMSRYATKMVNDKFYGKFEITGEAPETKVLTEEEFKAGKAGIVYLDHATNKIVFN